MWHEVLPAERTFHWPRMPSFESIPACLVLFNRRARRAIRRQIWHPFLVLSLAFLFFCLAAAYFYKQAPMRSTSTEESEQLKPLAGP